MCGLVGIVGLDGAVVDPAVLDRMSRVIRHRGPDDEGAYVDRSIGLGFRRLSILDLSPAGHQPMMSERGDIVIVFNGEIYNYLELREELAALGHQFRSRSDTEVLLHAYQEWGRQCLERLNGMWAFLVYDKRRGTLFGSRDRFGKKPLYQYRAGDHVLFGSEIKAILASGYYRGGVNWNMASRFLLHDSFETVVTQNETFYSGLVQVPAGSAFELDLRGVCNTWPYWSLADIGSAEVADPPGSFRELFDDAVRLRLRSDVPVGIFLSGGLDSTSIACAVAALRAENNGAAPLLAFSYQAREFDESVYIGDTVKRTGVELVPFRPDPRHLWDTLERVLWYQDEPIHSMVAVITFELSRLARDRGVKVILNGGGPDEFLAGYFNFFANYWQALITRGSIKQTWNEVSAYHDAHGGSAATTFAGVLATRAKAAMRSLPGGETVSARRRSASARRSWFTPEVSARLPADVRPEGKDPLHAALKYAVEVAPLPYYLRLEDRNSMAHSIEARMPFLDYRLVTLAFQLPSEWKMRGPWNKYLLRMAMRDRIPESARSRLDKMGFSVPSRNWFAGALFEPLQDLLASREFRERGIYRVDAIRRDLELHKAGAVDVAGPLLKVFQFEAWSRLRQTHQTAAVA